MTSNMPTISPAVLSELTPELKQILQQRMQKNLLSILATLSGTVFQRESPALDSYRDALARPTPGCFDEEEKRVQAFYTSVPLTSYDAYSPYVSRFFNLEGPCRVADLENLLSPGLPIFIAQSSGTSGDAPKYFPSYRRAEFTAQLWDKASADGATVCRFIGMILSNVLDVIDDDGNVVESLPVSNASSCTARVVMGVGPKDDEKLLSQKAKFWVSPFATYLLPSYRSNIFMNLLFALADPKLTVMAALFSTTVHDAIRVMVDNWETMVQAIEKGSVPEFVDLGKYRGYLEEFFSPNPSRTAELRKVEVGVEGWLKKVWPALTSVRVTLSGHYARLRSKLQYHFGPEIILLSEYYGATECRIGFAYDRNDTNLYRLVDSNHIELLDIEKKSSAENISKPWDLETGKKYEVIVTSTDGLWRYMLNDVVEVAGFSPTDGQPLIRYCERKGVRFRVEGEFISESLLQEVMSSLSDLLGKVLEFTTELDDRKAVGAYGFLVELEGEIGPNSHLALARCKESMYLHQGYKMWQDRGYIRDPTIRVVAPGTFQAYREWKIASTGFSPGQIKVPTAIADAETMAWLAERVVKEITLPNEDI